MKPNPIKFGTDGWRAIIAEDFTFDNVRICARTVAEYLKESGLAEKGLLIGYDTRFASEDFAAAAAETVAACGIKVRLSRTAAPTPVVSYGTLAMQAGGAIMITASHNPAAWNGLKLKSENGASVTGEVTARVESLVGCFYAEGTPEFMPMAQALEKGLVEYVDLAPVYTEKIESLVNLETIRNSGLKIVIDSMYGAGSGWLKKLLSGGSVVITEINGERNPSFPDIQPEPIAANLRKLSATVRKYKADIGIATDGDADRLGIIDENGVFLTTLQVFSLLTLYLLEVRRERGLIGKTINTSVMMSRLAELYGVDIVETPVGFKHIAPLLLERHALIGGEESGGYGFRGHVAERDGILAALYFLDFMAKTGKTSSQLVDYLYSKTGVFHYNRADIHFPQAERTNIIERVRNAHPDEICGIGLERIDTTDGFRFVLSDNSWLLIRFSGTEPLLRIYAESTTPEKVEALLEAGRKLAGL